MEEKVLCVILAEEVRFVKRAALVGDLRNEIPVGLDEGKTKLRVPLHNLDGIVCFGWDCYASAALMGACAEADVSLSFHNPYETILSEWIRK